MNLATIPLLTIVNGKGKILWRDPGIQRRKSRRRWRMPKAAAGRLKSREAMPGDAFIVPESAETDARCQFGQRRSIRTRTHG
jgi:hypothetical protein